MNIDARLNALFAPWAAEGKPGGVAAVVQNGDVLYARGFGLADLAQATPFTPQSVFHICSVTKQFTALCILMLEERGALTLDDPVHRHLPELPDFGAPVTIRHLTTNTSGLRDYMALPFLADGARFQSLSKDDTTRLIFAQRTLQSPPGARYGYSNTNFVLLGWIIERLTGRLLADVMHEWIFAPLGMTNTRFLTQSAPGPDGGVVGYYPDGKGGFIAPRLNVYEAGDGGIWSSLDDLIRWEKNFADCRVGSPELFKRLATPARLADGSESWYAHGLGTGRHRTAFWQGHSGGLSGMSINRLYFPKYRLSVVAASNGPALDTEALTFRMADLFLPGEEGTSPGASVSPGDDAAWLGTYQTDDRGRTAVLAAANGALQLEWLSQPYLLTRKVGAALQDESGICSVTVEGSGDQRVMRLRLGRGAPIVLSAQTSGLATPVTRFSGVYHSAELASSYTIEADQGDLSVTVSGPRRVQSLFALRRVADDVFYPLHDGRPLGVVLTFVSPDCLSVSASKAENILLQRTSP